MATNRLVPGAVVQVKRQDKALPAVIIGTIPTASLAWVEVIGEVPSLVDMHDLTFDPATTGEDDPSIWETDVIEPIVLEEVILTRAPKAAATMTVGPMQFRDLSTCEVMAGQ